MSSLPNEPDKWVLRYLKYYEFRLKGLPEDRIAKDLEAQSPLQLYQELVRYGFPVCLSCGTTPITTVLCQTCSEKRRLRAQEGEGEAIELPAAANAAPLFKEALQELGKAVDHLRGGERRDYLKDERFVAQIVSDNGMRIFLGAMQHPPEPLTRLIATYALADEPLELLLHALHYNPSEIKQERLKQAIEELRHKAGQLAKFVYGGELRRGRTTGEENSEKHLIGWIVHREREAGLSDEEIRGVLERHGYDIPLAEIRRLGNLRLH